MMQTLDLLAGTVHIGSVVRRSGTILVFDSGLGGLTVLAEVSRAIPDASIVYAADDAAFPYGALDEATLVERVVTVVGRLIARFDPELIVVACNTASTLALPALRSRFDIPFVGTVPAVKPAVAATKTGRIAILATPGTVKRDYTRALVETYAGNVLVELVGAKHLAALAEALLRGEAVDDAEVLAEIAPCFVDADGKRTDVIALACTHYPLLHETFSRVSPWPVTFIDPAAAIARRAAALAPVGSPPIPLPGRAVFTRGRAITTQLDRILASYRLPTIIIEPIPLSHH